VDESPLAGLDPTLFRPAFHGAFLGVEDGSATEPGAVGRVMLGWAREPVVYQFGAAGDQPVWSSVTEVDALVGWTSGRLRVGVLAPVIAGAAGPSGTTGGLGDLRLDGFASLGRGFALDARVSLPTSSVQGFGLTGPGGDLLLVAGAPMGRFHLAANTGPAFGPATRRGWVVLGGVGLEATSDLAFTAELDLRLPFDAAPPPLVVRGSGALDLSPTTSLRAGIGAGVTSGLGAPDLQLLVGLATVPGNGGEAPAAPPAGPDDPDPDGDGLLGDDDSCPAQAEDRDGALDDDGCPEPFVALTVVLRSPASLPARRWLELRDPDGQRLPGHGSADQWTFLAPVRGENTLVVAVPGYVVVRSPLSLDESAVVDVDLQPDPGFPFVVQGDTLVPKVALRWRGEALLGLEPMLDAIAPLLLAASGWTIHLELHPPNGDGRAWTEQLRAGFAARGVGEDRWSAALGPGPDRLTFTWGGPAAP
jgi:hypothetical protein